MTPRPPPPPRGPSAPRRAVWAVMAGCTGFYVLLYGFHRPVTALYAMFGALPLVLFCEVPGSARERTRTLLAALPVGTFLVTAGTLLAVRSWAAALGMLLVGFLVSFGAAFGPRLAALSIAFQLYYVLPCFPPYAPQTLGARLAGLCTGILLTVLAERFIRPQPPPVPFRVVLAAAAEALAECAEAGSGPAAARPALEAARLSRMPPAERPTSPSVRDRALNHTREALRHLYSQLERLSTTAEPPGPAATELLHRAAATLRSAAHALHTAAPSVEIRQLADAIEEFDATRAMELPAATVERLRTDAVVRAAAESAWLATEAARLAVGGSGRQAREPFRYAATPAWTRWWERLRLHLTPHSVLLQNAVRLAVALAVARLVVGELALAHGFWTLLATLSLMRTSAADTRSALGPAFLGTMAGAALSAALLYTVGDVPVFYAAATPVVILVGFALAGRLGPAWTQLVLTLAFLLVFSQLAVPNWHLPEVRLVDVLIGGSIGALAGLLAWPRGGHGQLRCATSDFIAESATACRTVTALLCQGRAGTPDPLEPAHRALLLAETCYLQYRTEHQRHPAPEPDWGPAMAVGYHLVIGAESLLERHRTGTPLPPPAAGPLTALADRVAAACRELSQALRAGHPAPDPGAAPLPDALCEVRRQDPGPGRILAVADAEAWLTGVVHDVRRTHGP
ncbi:FUSC family protein [Streptomyces sp. NPDC052396]|uniref:FUSC family protein n=1 Tax=Streptomyces sp. NPDC052396 TaxID=3365689 RepID=UPI0037CD73AE